MIVAVVNAKGGVGKTATAVSVAAALAGTTGRALLVDADSQAGASLGLGVKRSELNPSLAHPLLYSLPLERAIRGTSVPGLDLITASSDLANTDVALSEVDHREQHLRKLLDLVKRRYRAILIDCPSGLSLLQINALAAAEWFLLVTAPQYLALEGVAGMLDTAARVRSRFNRRLRALGIVVTMMDRRSKAAAEIDALLRRQYGRAVLRTVIPLSCPVAEAPSFGKTIFQYAPASPAAAAYHRLATELLGRAKRRARVLI